MLIQTINPSTNQVIKSFTEMTAKQFNEEVEKVVNTCKTWKMTITN